MALANFQVYIVSFGILIILLIRALADNERHFLHHPLFIGMIAGTMLAMAAEAASWVVDGWSGPGATLLVSLVSTVLFSVNVVPLMLWILYVDFQIFQNIRRLKRQALVLGLVGLANSSLAILSIFRPLYFYVDAGNIYHRGPWHGLAIALYVGLMLHAIILPIVFRQRIAKRLRLPLILFSLPSAAGIILQMAYYGLSLTWAGSALSLLIIYTSVQHQIMSTDYLTGLYNRRQLDAYIQRRIKDRHPVRPLAALMIDIDDFKSINDRFGHQIGDLAIESTAAVLRKTFHFEDFIARFAGDEFVVILELGGSEDLESVLLRLHSQFQQFNKNAGQPFQLRVSVGAAIYDPAAHGSADDLVREADLAMYRVKVR